VIKPSTMVELAGFACLAAAAFTVGLVVGLVVTGACLLLVGYATEGITIDLHAPVAQMRARFMRRRMRRRERQKKAA
jgi:hypothetical protein